MRVSKWFQVQGNWAYLCSLGWSWLILSPSSRSQLWTVLSFSWTVKPNNEKLCVLWLDGSGASFEDMILLNLLKNVIQGAALDQVKKSLEQSLSQPAICNFCSLSFSSVISPCYISPGCVAGSATAGTAVTRAGPHGPNFGCSVPGRSLIFRDRRFLLVYWPKNRNGHSMGTNSLLQ